MNVDRMKLYGMIEASLPTDFSQRDFVLWLTKEVVMNEPIINCRLKGTYSDWDGLPREKSLFYAAEEKGMPIGNLTSQLFSNIYLNQFDHWMKRSMKCSHYGRYVDDFYIVHKSKEYLLSLLPQITVFLKSKLGVTVHPEKIYLQECSKGVRFLGAVVTPYSVFPAKRITSKMKNTFVQIESGVFGPPLIRSRLNSYFGLLSHMSSYRLIQKYLYNALVPYYYGYFSNISGKFTYHLSKNLIILG